MLGLRIGKVTHLESNLGDSIFFTEAFVGKTKSKFFDKTWQMLKVTIALSSGHTGFDP